MRTVHVLRPGLLTTVQDLGRWGHQHLGVPVSGAMDVRSLAQANALAGNEPGAAALEATLVGPSLRVSDGTTIAAAGAQTIVRVNGHPHATPFAVAVGAGAEVAVEAYSRGARLYIAFDGGVATRAVLGSRSTDVRSGLGGLNGSALAMGDAVPLGTPVSRVRDTHAMDPVVGEWLDGVVRLRVLPGPQADGVLAALCANPLRLSSRCDRTGYRLEPALDVRPVGDLPSAPTVMGSVQVTPSGEAILLMADRQSIGGYAQAAAVICADLPLAGQLAPGARVRFVPCTVDEAIRASRSSLAG